MVLDAVGTVLVVAGGGARSSDPISTLFGSVVRGLLLSRMCFTLSWRVTTSSFLYVALWDQEPKPVGFGCPDQART
jgi:hypothetical protein